MLGEVLPEMGLPVLPGRGFWRTTADSLSSKDLECWCFVPAGTTAPDPPSAGLSGSSVVCARLRM